MSVDCKRRATEGTLGCTFGEVGGTFGGAGGLRGGAGGEGGEEGGGLGVSCSRNCTWGTWMVPGAPGGMGEGGGGEGAGMASACVATVGALMTVMPRTDEAREGVANALLRVCFTPMAASREGRVIEARMVTLAAITRTATDDAATPAATARLAPISARLTLS